MDEVKTERRRHAKDAIKRQLKRYLRSAREKEAMVLSGFAAEFCRTTGLLPEQIELVRVERPGHETNLYFRKREGALIIPKGVM